MVKASFHTPMVLSMKDSSYITNETVKAEKFGCQQIRLTSVCGTKTRWMDLASLLNQNSYTKGTSKMEKEAVEESSKRQMVKSMKAITSKICAKDKEDACILTSQYMKVSGVKD
jgi:hypothetical protein